MNYLPSNIAAIRGKWRESQAVFGRRFGMSHTNIGRYEGGDYEPTVSFCLRLAALTGISVERLATSALAADEIPGLAIGEGGALVLREPEVKYEKSPSADAAAILEALAVMTVELSEVRKRMQFLERKVELMDEELLRLGSKKR